MKRAILVLSLFAAACGGPSSPTSLAQTPAAASASPSPGPSAGASAFQPCVRDIQPDSAGPLIAVRLLTPVADLRVYQGAELTGALEPYTNDSEGRTASPPESALYWRIRVSHFDVPYVVRWTCHGVAQEQTVIVRRNPCGGCSDEPTPPPPPPPPPPDDPPPPPPPPPLECSKDSLEFGAWSAFKDAAGVGYARVPVRGKPGRVGQTTVVLNAYGSLSASADYPMTMVHHEAFIVTPEWRTLEIHLVRTYTTSDGTFVYPSWYVGAGCKVWADPLVVPAPVILTDWWGVTK
jgi:hypothetical protein